MSDGKIVNINPGSISDAATFETVFRQWYAPLCRTSYRITGNKEASEDLVQNIFVKLWEKKDGLDITISVKAYLYRAAINSSINYKQYSSKLVRPEADEWTSLPSAQEADQMLYAEETALRIQQAIDALPDACRSVFILSRYEEMSYKEIAETLQISVKTVENQMGKALKVLREKLIAGVVILLCIGFCLFWW